MPNSRHYRQHVITTILLAIPFIVYFIIFYHYIVDVPVWDDYVNPLDITNQAILAPTLKEKLLLLATPMNGHIPFLPRSLLYLQYLLGVESTIKTALLISNLGWMAATVVLLWHSHKTCQIPLQLLIPVPFLLLSITHWEAMDFYSSAFQMYWGSGLLAILGLIAASANRPITASLCFLAGLFTSGGALAVYPITLGYYFLVKRWKEGFIFLLCTLAVSWLYVHISPPQQYAHSLPNLYSLMQYTLEFTGNIISNGRWDMSAYGTLHTLIGIAMLIAAVVLIAKQRGLHAIKLCLVYVVTLGLMGGYMRMGVYSHAVSRYSMYALLALSCVYILLVASIRSASSSSSQEISVTLTMCGVLCVLLWAHSLYMCHVPLQINHARRTTEMQRYIESGDPTVLESWNATNAKGVLDMSKKIGLYDYTKALHH